MWDWDADKAAANLATHRVRVETAAAALGDPFILTRPDPHPDDDRWRSICMVGTRLLFVVHTLGDANTAPRIISARRATPSEGERYGRR